MKTVKILESSRFDKEGGFVEFLTDGELRKEELANVEEEKLPFHYKFLNPIQTIFYRFYSEGNALVSSATSSGKTLLALLFYLKNRENGRFVYTAPTRALIWEKFREFKDFFESIGIRTGDLIEELEEITQPAVVCTYESLLSAARNRTGWFETAGMVVIDEIHIIRDSTRGGGVEELVSYCLEEGIPLLALSATIPGADELARWIGAELFVDSDWRPVPLERKVFNMRKLLRGSRLPKKLPEEKILAVLESINPSGKTLIFLPRKDLGWQVLKTENSVYGRKVLNETLPFLVEEKEGEQVAFHNADVPQEERESIEKEFRKGKLNRLYATQTLAYGVNLPADNVVIFVRGRFDRLTYRYSFFPDPLTILQMEGRAGRFGLSEKGYSYIVVSGTSEESIERAIEEEISSPFSTALSSGVEKKESPACPNRRKSFISLMVLGPLVRYGGDWKRAVSNMFSFKKNPLLISEIESVVEELHEFGFLENNKPTGLTKLLVSSFVSPYCFMEFVERLKKGKRLKFNNPTFYYSFLVRPFIRRELNPSTSRLFVGKEFDKEAERIAAEVETTTGIPFNDNSEVLIFYCSGGFYPYINVARPPGELSTLPPETSIIALLLCRLNVFDFDTLHRLTMMVRGGVPFEFSLLSTVEGLGYMRSNALAVAGKLLKLSGEIALINGIRERKREIMDAIEEALSYRYSRTSDVDRERSQIVNIVDRVKFPLGNLKLLRYLASGFIGRKEAIKLTKREALEVLYENVKGQQEVESQD